MRLCDFTGWFPVPGRNVKAGCFIMGYGRYLVVRLCTGYPYVTVRISGLNDRLPAL